MKTDPLALAVADVICRVPLEQALAVVDSVLSGRTAGGRRLTVAEIQHWVDLIPVRRKRERAQLAWSSVTHVPSPRASPPHALRSGRPGSSCRSCRPSTA